jgi:hypothetical protein
MATKKAKATKAKKPAKKAAKSTKSTKQAHVPTPWLTLKQLWESGQSYEAMAKATDAHYDPKKPDPGILAATRVSASQPYTDNENPDHRIGDFKFRWGIRSKVNAIPL